MDRLHDSKNDYSFMRSWEQTKSENIFIDFDVFIIQKMGFTFETKEELEKIRRSAFLKFRKCTGHQNFATLPTMRKWFGITGTARPDREQVYEICLTMKMGIEEARSYLMDGLGESSFILSDYRELIFLYGLENSLSYEQCQSLIYEFEREWMPVSFDEELQEEQKLEWEYEKIKKENTIIFLQWMLKHSGSFVGYSPKTLNVLMEFRDEIAEFIRQDAKDKLDTLLAETDYANWVKTRRYRNPTSRESLRHYLKMHQGNDYYHAISESMGDNLLELSQIANSELKANTKLLSEVFSTSPKENRSELFKNIKGMTAKHLSDLFNIPLQKKRLYFAYKGKRQFSDMEQDSEVPVWFYKMMDITHKHFNFANVKEAQEWLTYYYSEQKRRCIHISRSDILPFVHYISQHRYLEKISSHKQEYDVVVAKNEFVVLANQSLKMCSMSPIDEKRELDALLLASFQPEEMYSFSDVLDMGSESEI